MSNIGIPPTLQTLTPSYALPGKSAAGLESPENKDQTLPPVEETNASEKNRHQPHQKAEALSSDHGGSGAQHQRHPAESEPQSAEEAIAVIEAAASAGEFKSAPPLETELQRAAALHGDNAQHGVAASTAVDRFNAAAGHTLAPGLLLDQRS